MFGQLLPNKNEKLLHGLQYLPEIRRRRIGDQLNVAWALLNEKELDTSSHSMGWGCTYTPRVPASQGKGFPKGKMNYSMAEAEHLSLFWIQQLATVHPSKKSEFFSIIITCKGVDTLHLPFSSTEETFREDFWKARTKTCFSVLLAYHFHWGIASYNRCPWIYSTKHDPSQIIELCGHRQVHRTRSHGTDGQHIGSSEVQIICTLGSWSWQPAITFPIQHSCLLPIIICIQQVTTLRFLTKYDVITHPPSRNNHKQNDKKKVTTTTRHNSWISIPIYSCPLTCTRCYIPLLDFSELCEDRINIFKGSVRLISHLEREKLIYIYSNAIRRKKNTSDIP